jgi:uncharacterized membrane protein
MSPQSGPGGRARLPRWTLLALVPFVLLAACAVYLAVHWSDIPARFPIHWGAHGPNGWASRTFLGVYGSLIFAAGMAAVLIGSGFLAYFGSRRSRSGEMMLRIMIGVSCFLALVFCGVGLLPLGFPPAAEVTVLPLLALTVIGIIVVTASGEPDEEPPPGGAPPLFVPRTIGWGYSFNFANPYAWKILATLLGGIGAMLLFLLLIRR